MSASNSNAKFKLRFFGPRLEDSVGGLDDDEIAAPFGYVDEVDQAAIASGAHRTAWFDAVVQRNPQELFELVDRPEGRPFAEEAARALAVFPANARWSDRFALATFGEAGEFTSDLSKVAVERPGDSLESSRSSNITIPRLTKRGRVIRAGYGPTPMPSPDARWLHVDGAVLQNGGTVIAEDRLIVYEAAADPKLDFVSGQWESVFGSRTHPEVALVQRSPQAAEDIPEGILLSGRNDSNWYHWLIEYLPRVMQLDDTIGPDVPLVISSRTPATGVAALKALTDREILPIDSSLAHRFGRLHIVAPPVQVLDTTRIPWKDGLSMNPQPLLAMREAWGLTNRRATTERRVFLQRNSRHRGMLNETELARIAAGLGMEVLDPSAMTWREQVEVFSSASLLVGASGAVMANYLLMSPGSRILALTSHALGDFILPAAIASIVGVEFAYLTGPAEVKLSQSNQRSNWLHSNFTIREEDFHAVVKAAIRDGIDRRHQHR